jgi:hypothetical protein
MQINTKSLAFGQDAVRNASVNMLSMVAERYLAIESADSEKMALEVTTSWNCRPVID